MTDNQQYLTPEDAAKIMGVKKKLLSNWRSSGRGPSFVKLGLGKACLVRYPLRGTNGLIQYMESRTRSSTRDNNEAMRHLILSREGQPLYDEELRLSDEEMREVVAESALSDQIEAAGGVSYCLTVDILAENEEK